MFFVSLLSVYVFLALDFSSTILSFCELLLCSKTVFFCFFFYAATITAAAAVFLYLFIKRLCVCVCQLLLSAVCFRAGVHAVHSFYFVVFVFFFFRLLKQTP